jgi:predicted enzyme related to lactoylglutathione lyase
MKKGKVTGIGGIFIKFQHPENMMKWYQEVLGLSTNDYGVLFSFNGYDEPKGYLQLGTFTADTDYFGQPKQSYMLNFRVDDLNELLLHLTEKNVSVLDSIETYDYGKFLHISDPEGNRIELWEPIDSAFDNETHVQMS